MYTWLYTPIYVSVFLSIYLENHGFKLITLVPVSTAVSILVFSFSVFAVPCLTVGNLAPIFADPSPVCSAALLLPLQPPSPHGALLSPLGPSTLPAFPPVHPAPPAPFSSSNTPCQAAPNIPRGPRLLTHSDVSSSDQPAPPAKWMLPFPTSGFKSMHRASFLFCLGSDSLQRTSLCSTPNLWSICGRIGKRLQPLT